MSDHGSQNGDNLLSEDELRQITRSVKSLLPKNAEEIKDLERLFERVFQVARTPELSTTHRVAAWNALCGLIDQCINSSEPNINGLLWNGGVWNRGFDLFITHSHNLRPKSSRQLLVALTTALKKVSPELDIAGQIKQETTRQQVASLNERNDHFEAKACASALAHFLSKEIVVLDDVLQVLESASPGAPVHAKLEAFLLKLFQWMNKGDFGSSISHLVSMILAQAPPDPAADAPPIWIKPLKTAFQTNLIDSSSLRAHLLPVLFKRSLPDYLTFLSSVGFDELFAPGVGGIPTVARTRSDDELLYASLQAGKELGIVFEYDGDRTTQEEKAIFVPVRGITRLLLRSSRPARIAGLSLVVLSQSGTKPISKGALDAVSRRLPHFFADTDADFRSQVFSLIQRLVDRIRSVTAVLARTTSKRGAEDEEIPDSVILKYHKEFLNWMVGFLGWELRPTASYQRHISTLKCLAILAKSGLDNRLDASCFSKTAVGDIKWPFTIEVMTHDIRRLLLDSLVDPFDDVRQLSSAILKFPMIASEAAETRKGIQGVDYALRRAESAMLATGRADQADGVAHLYTLLYQDGEHKQEGINLLVKKLVKMLDIGKTDIAQAVEKYPIHGLLTSLRYILAQDPTATLDFNLKSRLTDCLHDVWTVVKPILCDDAPEGYLPEGQEDTAGTSTKDTLSYCWRALKEASLLLGVLITSRNDSNTGETEILKTLCDLCFTQLAELRHRGAFSTVAQTWISCCMQSTRLPAQPGTLVLQSWYQKVIMILRNKTTINTRRSAGFPSLLCGILVAEKSDDILRQAFSELEVIAREEVDPKFAQEGSLPQVHAMNCMKDILKNTRLGDKSERLIPEALQLAADALRSKSWAVRNCGLMLFRGVIDRLLGTTEANEDSSPHQKRVSADQHPGLLDIVLDLLATPAAAPTGLSSGSEGVFPALQLLQRIRIPADILPEARQSVFTLTASPEWLIRDKAARAYASFIDQEQTPQVMERLLQTTTASQNELHGALLCAKYIIAKFTAVQVTASKQGKGPSDSTGSQLRLGLDILRTALAQVTLYQDNKCPFTRGAYIDILTESLSLLQSLKPPSGVLQAISDSHVGHEATNVSRLDFSAELNTVLQNREKENLDAVSLTALARGFAQQVAMTSNIPEKASKQILERLRAMAANDIDASAEFFNTLDSCDLSDGQNETVMKICERFVMSDVHISLQSSAIRTMLHILDNQPADGCALDFNLLSNWFSQSASQATANPEFADLWLQLHAASVEAAYKAKDGDVDNLQRCVDDFTAGHRETGIFSREATALALSRWSVLWKILSNKDSASPQFLRLCLLVYDLTNDDDEDVRILTSSAACRILATAPQYSTVPDLEPIIANERLICFLIKNWPNSIDLALEAFQRAYFLSPSGKQDRPVSSHLENGEKKQTALFAEEKQNLYVDPSQEILLWSSALKLLPSTSLPFDHISRLTHHTTSALSTIRSKLSLEGDGPLGWTSADEIFPLGLQAICGVETLMFFVERGVQVPLPHSAIYKEMVATTTAFAQSAVNSLWRGEMKRVWFNAAGGRVGDVNGILWEVWLTSDN